MERERERESAREKGRERETRRRSLAPSLLSLLYAINLEPAACLPQPVARSFQGKQAECICAGGAAAGALWLVLWFCVAFRAVSQVQGTFSPIRTHRIIYTAPYARRFVFLFRDSGLFLVVVFCRRGKDSFRVINEFVPRGAGRRALAFSVI